MFSLYFLNMFEYEVLVDVKFYMKFCYFLLGYVYECGEDGFVYIINYEGVISKFMVYVEWIEGLVCYVDLYMCDWIGGELLLGLGEEFVFVLDYKDSDVNWRVKMVEGLWE